MHRKGRKSFFANLWKRNRYSSQEMNGEMLLDYFQSLAEHHPDLIIILSSSGEILSNNVRSINRLLGYSGGRKLDYFNILPKQIVTKLKRSFQEALNGKTLRHNIVIENKKNKKLYLEVTFVPITNVYKEQVVHLLVRDVTANLQMDQSLKLKGKNLDHVYEIAKIGSWTYFIDEDEFIFERECLDIFGFHANDSVSSKRFFDRMHEDDQEKVRTSFHQLIESGVVFQTQFRIYHNVTNSVRSIKSYAEVLYENKKPYKVVGMMKDLTEKAEIRNELLENKKRTNIYLTIYKLVFGCKITRLKKLSISPKKWKKSMKIRWSPFMEILPFGKRRYIQVIVITWLEKMNIH